MADDLSPEAGDNVKLTLAVVQPDGAKAVDETCIVQVFSQPGRDAAVEPLVILTGPDGEAMTTLFVGSTPGAVEVSAQCGNASATVVLTLNVRDTSAPASLLDDGAELDDGAGSVGGLAEAFGSWSLILVASSGALTMALVVSGWFVWRPLP